MRRVTTHANRKDSDQENSRIAMSVSDNEVDRFPAKKQQQAVHNL